MSREGAPGPVFLALRAAAEASGGDAEVEVLLRVSHGTCVRRARGTPDEVSAWREESVAVRALVPGGGEGLCAASSWRDAEGAARRAVELAMADTGEGADGDGASRMLAPRALATPSDACPALPQTASSLAEALDEIAAEAMAEDDRVVALDAALARSAVVGSYLASTAGLALHQRHATAAAHAAVIARDGMQVAVRGDAWAGPVLTMDEARRLGRRLGRAGLVHLIGSGAAPPSPRRLLLSATAVAEISTAFAHELLGLAPAALPGADDLPAPLSLVEDACEDLAARRLPADGAGRLLARLPVIEHGAWTPPGARRLPRVRPGSGDAPRPGALRLTWTWRDGEPEDALLTRLGTGLWIDTLHAVQVDRPALAWRGAASGFWVEDGRRKHAVSGVPFSANLLDLLRGAVTGGDTPQLSHASGLWRAIPLVIEVTQP